MIALKCSLIKDLRDQLQKMQEDERYWHKIFLEDGMPKMVCFQRRSAIPGSEAMKLAFELETLQQMEQDLLPHESHTKPIVSEYLEVVREEIARVTALRDSCKHPSGD